MDYSEATKVLFDRIKKIDPDKPNKTLGYILLQDPEEGNLIRLAHAPDQFLDNLVQKAKHHFKFLAKSPASASNGAPSINISTVPDIPLQFGPFSANSLRSYSSPVSIRIPTSTTCDSAQLQVNLQPNLSQDFAAFNYGDSAVEEYGIQSQAQFVGYDNQFDPVSGGGSASYPEDFYHPDATLGNLRSRTSRRSPSLPEFPIKTCHYYKRGFCKHGNSCRFFHGPEKFSSVFASNSSNELSLVDDHVFSPGSREKLELEITELLKLRRGNPVSIASLPMLYYEKYGRHIQAEGYLTESQRHGRAGYSLTKLLARLSSIQLVDRPHGQHSVILAEDAAKYYLENFGDRNDPGPIVCGSRQIYLTFPAESTFSEEDVSNYFSNFGHVEEVRIPCQQKRMFGFVTFASADTVKSVLAKRNPHFVCGSRVLVKPYREKSKLIERKYMEKSEHPINYTGSYFELEHDFHSLPRGCDAPRFLRRQLTEKQEQALEFERRRLSELQLMQNHFSNQPCLAYAMENLDASEDQYKFTSPENLNNFYDALNIGSSSNDRSTHEATKYSDQESSQGIGLPDNPFTGAIGSSISTVT